MFWGNLRMRCRTQINLCNTRRCRDSVSIKPSRTMRGRGELSGRVLLFSWDVVWNKRGCFAVPRETVLGSESVGIVQRCVVEVTALKNHDKTRKSFLYKNMCVVAKEK